MSETKQIEV